MRIVNFVNLDALNFLKLLDSALNLHRLCGLISEFLDKFLCVVNHFLLILISALLLLDSLFAQFNKVRIIHVVVINFPTRNFDGAIRDIINKRLIVRNEHQHIGLSFQKILKPLNRLNVQMVGRLIEQQHIGALEQNLSQFNTHSPPSAKLRGGAVEVSALKAQANQGFLYLGFIVLALIHCTQIVFVRQCINQILITF